MQYAGSAWDELKHIRQAIGFLVPFCFSLYSISTPISRHNSGEATKIMLFLNIIFSDSGHTSKTKENTR